MADYQGQQLGNYRLLRLLGRGGFAEVYLGEHVRLGMKAAIKVLHTRLSGDEIQAFQQEAQIIADLKHPHIIRVLDFDVQENIPFLVLDYAPHGSLRHKYMRGTRLPLFEISTYVSQIASALQYAHDRNLVHRDIKPENMLLGDQGEVLLSDFGIATIAHSTSSMSTQAALGTLTYMAPEQIQGKPRKESDQYALAVTVYQWISGEPPFQGSSTEIIAQHLAMTPPLLRDKALQLPLQVEQVVMTALAKDPKERFASVQAFAYALKEACQLTDALPPTATVAASPPPQTGAPVPSSPTLYAPIAPGSLWCTYRGHEEPVLTFSWSPDARQIVSASFDGIFHVWNTNNGTAAGTFQGHAQWPQVSEVTGLAWSPDGKYIATSGVNQTACIWNASTGYLGKGLSSLGESQCSSLVAGRYTYCLGRH